MLSFFATTSKHLAHHRLQRIAKERGLVLLRSFACSRARACCTASTAKSTLNIIIHIGYTKLILQKMKILHPPVDINCFINEK